MFDKIRAFVTSLRPSMFEQTESEDRAAELELKGRECKAEMGVTRKSIDRYLDNIEESIRDPNEERDEEEYTKEIRLEIRKASDKNEKYERLIGDWILIHQLRNVHNPRNETRTRSDDLESSIETVSEQLDRPVEDLSCETEQIARGKQIKLLRRVRDERYEFFQKLVCELCGRLSVRRLQESWSDRSETTTSKNQRASEIADLTTSDDFSAAITEEILASELPVEERTIEVAFDNIPSVSTIDDPADIISESSNHPVRSGSDLELEPQRSRDLEEEGSVLDDL